MCLKLGTCINNIIVILVAVCYCCIVHECSVIIPFFIQCNTSKFIVDKFVGIGAVAALSLQRNVISITEDVHQVQATIAGFLSVDSEVESDVQLEQ